jgi:hypothetical protein
LSYQPKENKQRQFQNKSISKVMAAAISWSNYVVSVLVVMGCYYLVIGYRYYRQDIKNLLSGKWKPRKVSSGEQTDSRFEIPEDAVPMEGLFDELEEIVYDIKTTILETAGTETDKDALITLLKERLENYRGLRKPAIRMAVNHFVMQQSLETCDVQFTEEELNAAWETLAG